ncbi:hypothetical protein DAERI_130044 [Deinococcus aerius]|uniref:BrnT family toxin n=1 Tax=Deinococcus aerius TaxID=200253 RepID=A0A2I9CYI5_9DEIO|nr:BrnT family toxin [Deinococcus aerius]GBF07214.1 hypothetical protein DAERI_130044 [Deinococcus aerius]
MEFNWDFANLEHIARHKVEPEEAEEAATDPDAVSQPAHRGPGGQARFAFIGATEAGRLLVVVLEPRGEKARVVTARPASTEERRRYELQE